MKVNNPRNIEFPIIVKRREWSVISNKLQSLGYLWNGDIKLKDYYPFRWDNWDKIEISNKHTLYQDIKRLSYKKLDS